MRPQTKIPAKGGSASGGKVNNIRVPKKNAGERLDVFLSKKLKINRSQIQKMIEAEQVFINKKLPRKAGDNLKEGGTIVILSKAKQSPQTEGLPRLAKARLAMTPKIIAA